MPEPADARLSLGEVRPRLIDVAVPAGPEGAVIVLHGGASRRDRMRVSSAQLSVVRMVPIARRIARAGRGRLAVFRLLNSRRGWDATHTPVQDTRWAIAQVRDRVGGAVPICLVGHSLGGRAALLAAGEPEVAGAVALAPWVLPSDTPRGVDGKPILIVHGSRDRVADPAGRRRWRTNAGRSRQLRGHRRRQARHAPGPRRLLPAGGRLRRRDVAR